MSMRSQVDIWNVLHDGSIVAFIGECPGDISVKVEIEYLCEVLATGSKFLWVHLRSCSDAVYSPFGSSASVMHIVHLGDCDLEILSAKEEENHISVCCTEGILRLDYLDANCELDTGIPVPVAMLSQACKKYWDDWDRHSKDDR